MDKNSANKLKKQYNILMKNEEIFRRIAKEKNLDPESKNFKYDYKIALDLYEKEKYDELMQEPEFKKIANEMGISKKDVDFSKKFRQAQEMLSDIQRMNKYDELMKEPEFEEIANEMGIDKKDADFFKKFKQAEDKFYGMKRMNQYNKLIKDPEFKKIAEEIGVDPNSKDFAERLKEAKNLYHKANNKDNKGNTENVNNENNSNTENVDNKNNTDIRKLQISHYNYLMQDPEFKKIAEKMKLDPNSKDFDKKLKEVHNAAIREAQISHYNYLMQDPEFKKIAENMKLDPNSKDFDKKFDEAQLLAYNVWDNRESVNDENKSDPAKLSIYMLHYNRYLEKPAFAEIAKKIGVDINSKDFVEKFKEARTLYYKELNTYHKDNTENVKDENNSDTEKKNDNFENLGGSEYFDEAVNKYNERHRGGEVNGNNDAGDKTWDDFIDEDDPIDEDIDAGDKTWDDFIDEDDSIDAGDNTTVDDFIMDSEWIKNYGKAKKAHDENLQRKLENNNQVKIKFDAKKGVYQLFNGENLLKEVPHKKMSFFARRKFIKEINQKDGNFESYVEVGKYVYPEIYELLKFANEEIPLENGDRYSTEYLRALKTNNPKYLKCKIDLDLTGLAKKKKIGFFEKLRIKKLAKLHEERDLATVERDPKKRLLPRILTGALAAGVLGTAAIGIASHVNKEDTLDEVQPAMTDTSDKNHTNKDEDNKVKNEENKETLEDKKEIPNKVEIVDEKDNKNDENKETDGQEKQEENQTGENKAPQDEEQEKNTEDLIIGKEVTVDTDYLYYNCAGANPKCDLNKFMKNNPNAKFILGRIAVKNSNGYPVNTTAQDTSLDELKEQYGEDAEYFCNFRVETPSGTYVDIGWTSTNNVKPKVQENEKENPWKVDEKQLNGEKGKSGASKDIEEAVTSTLKDRGIDVEF